ncbi:MAG: hypothetical protein IKL89_06300 [Clostridia bacterium]|nr:hypothetical protein [Clostridia bacterium]
MKNSGRDFNGKSRCNTHAGKKNQISCTKECQCIQKPLERKCADTGAEGGCAQKGVKKEDRRSDVAAIDGKRQQKKEKKRNENRNQKAGGGKPVPIEKNTAKGIRKAGKLLPGIYGTGGYTEEYANAGGKKIRKILPEKIGAQPIGKDGKLMHGL